MQGIVGARVKFILFLFSMVLFFLLLSRTYMHTCVQLQSGFSYKLVVAHAVIIILPAGRLVGSGYDGDYS